MHARHVARSSAPEAVQLEPAADAWLWSPAARELARRLAGNLTELGELAKHEPAAADQLVGSLVAHMRSVQPEAVSPMTLGPPTEPIRDPRGPRGGR